MSIIKPEPISGFPENLPEEQIIEDKFKRIITDNYSKSGFVSIETPVVEREEILTSKWWDDNEVYWIHRLNWEKWDDSWLWLRFDLTVPLARYVSMHDNDIVYPFRRQQIQKVYRWERAQKWRYREFYQADVDIIWNWKLSLFADVEVISTINNALEELSVWDYVINLNNKKLLVWFLISVGIEEDMIWMIISIIDKKDKVDKDKVNYPKTKEILLSEIWDITIVENVIQYIKLWNENNTETIFDFFSNFENEILLEWIEELKYVHKSLQWLWIGTEKLKINPSISRWLDYYTWTVFETFISWYENMWSISSWWRYENLASNFSKKQFPWVWWSIWLSRLLAILKEIGKLNFWKKSPTDVLVLNLQDEFLERYLDIIKWLRSNGISSELYLDSNTKMQKQFKYAENNWIPLAIIAWEDEFKNWYVWVKDLKTRIQEEIKIKELNKIIKWKI